MADQLLFSKLKERLVPKFNQDIVHGLAKKHLAWETVKAHIDDLIRSAEESFPKGFVYTGSERCTPIEEYNVGTKLNKGKRPVRKKGKNVATKSAQRTYDIARSDMYMIKLNFEFNGVKFPPKYLYLPIALDGGLIHVNDNIWGMFPVLADEIFSVGIEEVFTPVMSRAKVTFYRDVHSIVVDGVRQYAKVVYSPLHNNAARKKQGAVSGSIRLGSVHTSLVHYLMCKYGVTETFLRYCNCRVKVVDTQELTNYDKEEYVLITSAGMKPVFSKIQNYDCVGNKIGILIPRSSYTPLATAFACGFFYVVDHFPVEMTLSQVDSLWQWKVLLGYILWGDAPGHGKLVEDVDTHLVSIGAYVDLGAKRNLSAHDIHCNDIYDLMVYILENINQMLLNPPHSVASMYGKKLMILRYVLSDINNAIFKFLFEITSNSRRAITERTLAKTLSEHFKPKLVYGIAGNQGHGEVNSVSCPNDNKFFKITSNIVQQVDTKSSKKSKNNTPFGPSHYLDVSYCEVGSYLVLPKTFPIGKKNINPTVLTDESGNIIRKEHYRELTDSVQNKIKR